MRHLAWLKRWTVDNTPVDSSDIRQRVAGAGTAGRAAEAEQARQTGIAEPAERLQGYPTCQH